eukprot:symbB.v1.2.021902.t1/scaffold1923.1/size95945/2
MGGGHRRRGGRCRGPKEDRLEEASEVVPLPGKRGRCRSQGIKPSQDEVLLCIESLYHDKLKPFGRILRKRVAERAVVPAFVPGSTTELPDVDVKHLKEICMECDALEIAPEEGGDWSATFKDREQHFVDIYSSNDDYSPAIWRAASQYFEHLPEDDALLPGGRYSCAQALQQRHLDFLKGFSLGEVCHLVQLAISQHKILGYCNGAVVPYRRSQSRVKEECAVSQQPCLTSGPSEDPQSLTLASLQKARECLKEILSSAESDGATTPAMIPLSNVKRLFRSRYQIELSETALGHSKLSELLQDQRFSDICEVQLQGQGYIVVQVLGGNTTPTDQVGAELSDEGNLETDAFTPVLDAQREEPMPLLPTPLASPGLATPNTVSRWPAFGCWRTNLAAHGSFWGEAPPLPLAGGRSYEEAKACDSTDSTADSARSGEKTQRTEPPPSPVPSAGNQEAPETPMKVELSILQRMHAALEEEPLDGEEETRARIPFCPGEPLALEEALDRLPHLRDAEHVKNTFIHSAATPLVTPEPPGYRRSQSVPKEMGYAAEVDDLEMLGLAGSVVPSPAFLVPPTPSSPIFSRGYEAMLLPQMDFLAENRVIRLADLI